MSACNVALARFALGQVGLQLGLRPFHAGVDRDARARPCDKVLSD